MLSVFSHDSWVPELEQEGKFANMSVISVLRYFTLLLEVPQDIHPLS